MNHQYPKTWQHAWQSLCLLAFIVLPNLTFAQALNPCYELVWSDEFDAPRLTLPSGSLK